MDLLDDCDDLLGLGSTEHIDSLGKSIKALQSLTNRQQERQEKEQQQSKKRARQDDELAAFESGGGEATAQRLAEQQQRIDAMGAKVQEELQKGDSDGGGPEPVVYAPAIEQVQPLPALQLQEVPEVLAALQQQRQLLGLPADDDVDNNSNSNPCSSTLQQQQQQLLARGSGPLSHCPSAATARVVFSAVCYGDNSLAAAAYNRFMAWCGEPEVIAGSQVLPLNLLHKWTGGPSTRPDSSTQAAGTILADSMPPTHNSSSSIKWLPSAADVLQALSAFGVKQAQQQQQLHASQRASQQQQSQCTATQQQRDKQQQQGLAYRHGNLPLLLQLLGRVCGGHTAGRLDASGLCNNQQHLQQLLLSLLGLMLDQRALLTCSYLLPEAFTALLELPDARLWDRIVCDTRPGSLLDSLSGGLGPSHRASVVLLGQLPGSRRGNLLRQLGALQLLGKIIPGAKRPAPPTRISAAAESPQVLQAQLHKELQALLGPPSKVRALLSSLCDPPGPGNKLQVWLVLSVMEAAHHVLWVDASTQGIGKSMHAWFLQWLEDLDRAVEKKLSSHQVRRLAAMLTNTYTFAQHGCVVARDK